MLHKHYIKITIFEWTILVTSHHLALKESQQMQPVKKLDHVKKVQ